MHLIQNKSFQAANFLKITGLLLGSLGNFNDFYGVDLCMMLVVSQHIFDISKHAQKM